ncbi:MAG: hypothetical protein EOM73_14280 [Bacteroidia bacterium]|nr:hypothetical protein [Bacteroidia bacterium]
MKYNELNWQQKNALLADLSAKIYVQGAVLQNDQYLQLRLKRGANMNNVKAILRKYFGIKYVLKYDWETCTENRYAATADIEKLCKVFLQHNVVDLEYINRFDPLREKNTIAKVIYQYGAVRYDLLHV